MSFNTALFHVISNNCFIDGTRREAYSELFAEASSARNQPAFSLSPALASSSNGSSRACPAAGDSVRAQPVPAERRHTGYPQRSFGSGTFCSGGETLSATFICTCLMELLRLRMLPYPPKASPTVLQHCHWTCLVLAFF